MKPQNVRLLLIGSELLNGYIADKNLAYFARKLYNLGHRVIETRIIHDSPEAILSVLNEWSKTGDLLITTGGLGPTDDDTTVDTLCSWLGVEPEFNQDIIKRIEKVIFERYKSENRMNEELKKRILRQARIPKGAIALKNTAGLAPGIFLPDVPLIALPGFPVEIESIWPDAQKRIESLALARFASRVVPIWGVAEGTLFDTIHPPEKIQMGVHALPWGSKLFFMTPLGSPEDEKKLDDFVQEIERKYKRHIMDDPVETWVAYLQKISLTFATAESCTGGLGAKLATDLAGVSSVYRGSAVAYANEIKENILGVSHSIIEQYGAVSKETAQAMAENTREKFKTGFAFSTTGIAGPSGGTPEKPLGTVYIGIASHAHETLVGKFLFPFSRDRFREAVVYTAYLALCQRFCLMANKTEWDNSHLGKIFRPV